MQVLRDRQLGAALGAGPFFWLVLSMFRAITPDLSWPLHDPLRFLLAALVYPVLEEATFRGLLQPVLHQREWGKFGIAGVTLSNGVTSLVFAASHLVWHNWQHALAVLVPSLVFGYFRDRTGRIGPSVLLHITYNSGFIWLFATFQG